MSISGSKAFETCKDDIHHGEILNENVGRIYSNQIATNLVTFFYPNSGAGTQISELHLLDWKVWPVADMGGEA